MGSNELVVIGLFAAPIVLLLLLRVNATLAYLTLCLGYVTMQFLGNDIGSFADLFLGHTSVSTNLLKLGLLLAPLLLTMLFMAHTVRGTRATLNILPAIAAGCLTVLLVVPVLSPGMAHAIMQLSLWHQVEKTQSLIVGAGALISLFFLWAQRRHHAPEKKSEKRH